MKGLIIFSILIACCLALPITTETDSAEIQLEDSAAEPLADNPDPAVKSNPIAALFGRTTTQPPADALIVYVRPGGIFRRRTTTSTTTAATTTASTTTSSTEGTTIE